MLVVAGHLGLGADLCEPLAEQDDLVARRGELTDVVVGDAGDGELLLGAGVEQAAFDIFVARLGVGLPDEHVGAELALMIGHGVLAGLEFEDAEVLFALEHDVELAVEAVAGREAACLGEVSGAEGVLGRGPLGERGEVAEDLVSEVGEPSIGDARSNKFEPLRSDHALHALVECAGVAGVDVEFEEVAQELVDQVSDDDGLADVFLLPEVDEVAAGAGTCTHPLDLDDVGDGEGEVGLDDEDRSGVDGVEGVSLLVVAGDGAEDGDLGTGRQAPELVVDIARHAAELGLVGEEALAPLLCAADEFATDAGAALGMLDVFDEADAEVDEVLAVGGGVGAQGDCSERVAAFARDADDAGGGEDAA